MSSHPFPEALRRCGGDPTILKAAAAMVLDDAPEQMKQISAAIKAGDSSQLAGSAHTLKGMLGTFHEAAALAGLQAVETLAKAGNLDAASDAWRECEARVQELVTEIRVVADS